MVNYVKREQLIIAKYIILILHIQIKFVNNVKINLYLMDKLVFNHKRLQIVMFIIHLLKMHVNNV